MSAISTATVETLTAEVRVLMVGSRQVTLSVAKQLDFHPLQFLDVFGRVKIGARDPDGLERLTVIGRNKRTGVLALAAVRSEIDLRLSVCGCNMTPGQVVNDRHPQSAHPELVEAHAAARRAPLIVLAGLK